VCTGMPGALPVLNGEVVRMAVMLGLATNSTIRERARFARKNYLYPDLPKGYQISQFDEPLCSGGFLDVRLGAEPPKRIGITRIHVEEDAGKNIHDEGRGVSYLDFNRCGVPLLEIVSEPDMRNPLEAVSYLKELRTILLYLGICDGNMEEGSFRCDANISLRETGAEKFGTKVELKNMNSFRHIERALNYEIERQKNVLLSGGGIVQETRLYDADRNITESMRSKEEAHDYRYFPEPDLLYIVVPRELVDLVGKGMPALPEEKRRFLIEELKLPEGDAATLTADPALLAFYEEALGTFSNAKALCNFILTELLGVMNREGAAFESLRITPEKVSKILAMVEEGRISGKMAKSVFAEVFRTGEDPEKVVQASGGQVTDEGEIEKMIDEVISENASEVEKYRAGKESLFGFFVGQAMKKSRGKANPQIVNRILKEKLR
ncbi:MAG: Asp-tRNA(Asn)/Glu-tRNA(Gln) amidotransferase subunit GatB, partial [Deltaproteobacteria bacterium]|nr:Asp-tRNA(Asn)/Glu-tRNA(Gln) amidotransferase subunit GatB [Deltaproteobacteria bacterium]